MVLPDSSGSATLSTPYLLRLRNESSERKIATGEPAVHQSREQLEHDVCCHARVGDGGRSGINAFSVFIVLVLSDTVLVLERT